MIDWVKQQLSVMGTRITSNIDLKGDPVDIVIDKDKCVACDACLDECPMVRFGGFTSIEDPRVGYLCLQCGGCVAVCHEDAISIGDLPSAVPAGKIPSSDTVLNLIKMRRSVRSFKGKKISDDQWEKLIEAFNYSPVGHNSPYLRLEIIQSPDVLKALSRIGMNFWEKTTTFINMPVLRYVFKRKLGAHAFALFSKLAPFYDQQKDSFERGLDPILFNAPAVMLFLAPQDEMMGQAEANMAAQTVALYAPALGLGTCYSGVVMALFSSGNVEVRKVIEIPQGYNVYSALIVGHPKHMRHFVPYRREREVHHL